MKNVKNYLILVIAVIAVIILLHLQANETEAKGPAGQATEDTIDIAITEDIKNSWISYIDRRVQETIQRNGNNIRLIDPINEMMGLTVFISENSPYAISCDVGGGKVTFGYSRDTSGCEDGVMSGTEVNIYGVIAEADESTEKSPPPGMKLFQGKNTEAIRDFQSLLCQRISSKVQEIIGRE